MRKKGKYLVALALVLAVALGWTGLQLVSGQEVYHAPELVLLEGQADYDLLSGIEYDAGQYALNLADDGGFDVDTLGTYTLRYELTPQSAPSKEPVAEGTQQPAPPQEPVVEETESPAEPISFTRQVMVKEAVSYDDVRLEQGSQDLLGGIATASQGYQISVVTDGGFDPNQVEEYEVTYSLRRADNGKELRKFSRYIQVTQPGVEFTAPELVAQGDVTGRDWLDGIEYDHSQYTLTLLTQPDIANQQPQRLRYSLTQGETVVAVFGREVTILGGTQAAEPSQAPASVPGQDQPAANGAGDTPSTLEYTGNLLLTLPSGTATDYTTAVEVFQAITQAAGTEAPGTYRVDLLKDYTWTADDQAALTALTGLEAGDTLTLTGDPEQTGAGVYKMTFKSNFVLPMKSAATYKIEYIVAQGGYLIANGSPLILGEGMNITGAYVFGGGYLTGSEKFEGNTNLTILSGSYSWVGAGSLGETTLVETTGDNHLTIGGGQSTVQIAQLVGLNSGKGSGYDYTHTGSSTVDLLKNSVVEGVIASNKPYATSTQRPTAKSNVQTGGTITISAHEGSSIGYMLEGTENASYSGTAELDTVVFVLAGTHEIFGLHSFDYLILEENAHLTGSSLNADARMVTSVGEVIFRANSTFILEGRTNSARCGSLKTEGENALFAVGRSVTLTSDQPMDASGGPLGLKFDDDRVPGNGHIVLETTAPISPQDFICKVPQPGFTTANGPDGTDIRFVWTYVQLTTPSGAVSEWGSTAQAYQEIARVAGTEAPGTYRVDLLKDYTWTAADQAALTALAGLEAGDTLTLTGDPQKTGAGVYTLNLSSNTDLIFPYSSPATYRVEQISIDAVARYIIANGSPLTLGEGITTSGTIYVAGGELISAEEGDGHTYTMDTNLTVLSGTYDRVTGGSYVNSGTAGERSLTFRGNTNVVVGGNVKVVKTLSGGNIYDLRIGTIQSVIDGDVNVRLEGETQTQNLLAGSETMTNASYLIKDEITGTATVTVAGGSISSKLGGTAATNSSTSGQLKKTVFQIEGKQSIHTVQDFDQLILAEGAHLTVTYTLHYMGSGKEAQAAGQVVFGANSQLTPVGISRTVGSLKTQGEGAVLEIKRSSYLYVDAADAPMDASGGPLGIKYVGDVAPFRGDILVQYNKAKGEADRSDYAYKFPQEGFMLSADIVNGHITLGESNIKLTTPSGVVTQWVAAVEAYQEIARVAGTEAAGTYRVDLLKNYTWTASDQAALTALTGLEAGDTLTLTGDPEKTGTGVYALSFASNTDIVFPPSSSASYRVEQIKITGGTRAIAANGSPLTMGEGITVSGNLDVVGGGLTAQDTGDYTFTGNSNLTVLSGTYRFIAGGSRPTLSASGTRIATTQGNTQVTVGGTTVVSNAVVGGNLLSATSTPWTKSVVNGSTSITFTGEAQAANIYAGSTSISYPNYMQTDTVTGTSTVTVSGGTITKVLGGTAATYDVTSGQLNQVVFQINGAQTIPTVQDFDQLTLSDSAHLTVTRKLHYNGSGKEQTVAGQVVFGKGSVLTTPAVAAASLTVGSLKTEGEGAVLEITKNYRLYVDAADAPMDASGGPLGIKYKTDAAPAKGNILVQYNKAKGEADGGDYAYKFPQEGFLLMADATNGYIMLGERSIRLTVPSGAVTEWVTAAEAYREIDRVVGAEETGTYRVDLIKDYTWTAGDQAALTALNGLDTGDILTLTSDPEQTGAGVYTFTLSSDTDVVFPLNSPASYQMEQIKIAGGTRAIAGNGSNLTMGEGITVTGVLDVVGGGLTSTYLTVDYTFTGNSHLTVQSGTYRFVAGGSLPRFEGGPYEIRLNTFYGTTYVSVTGDAVVTHLVGGSLPSVYLGAVAPFVQSVHQRQEGAEENGPLITVELSGNAVVTNLSAGNGSTNYEYYLSVDRVMGQSVVKLNGGTVKTFLGGSQGTYKTDYEMEETIFQVNGDYSIPTVQDFDQLVLAKEAHLTVSTKLHYKVREAEADGQVVFGANSVLTLPGKATTALTVGSLKTEGEGAVLEITRGYPLGVQRATDSRGGKLTLRFNPSDTQALNGDKLLYFSAQPNLADASHYLSGFPGKPGLEHSQTTGYVLVATNIITLRTNSGAETYYPSVATAMKQIETLNNASNSYTITVRKQHYTMTEEDLQAIDQFKGMAKSITFTSTFKLTASDLMGSGESVGQTVTRHVIIDGDLSFRSDTTMQNIYLEYQGHDGSETTTVSHNIYANGHSLTMGVGVDTGSGNYPTLYGGSKTEAVTGTTNLTVQSGTYEDIYGGGQLEGASVTGTNIRYEEFAVLNGSLYGGGKAGDVNGDVSVVISGGTTGGQTDSKVIAGGETGNVSGTAQLTISGGTAGKTMVVAGADNGTVVNAAISILEPSSGSEPSAPKAHVYGGAYGSGSVTGTASVTIGNGTYYGTISGGDLDGGMPGSSTISFSGSELKMENLVNFSTLNLGYGGNKCNLSVTGQLDSNTTAGDNFGRTGQMIFNSGSILNLTGKSAHKVGSIQTTTTGGASHLHISKAEGISYPLYISEGNNSEKGYTINVGIPDSESAPPASRPAEGDDVLIFAQANQVDMSQYLCGLTMLSLVQNAENPAIVELGIASEVQAKLTAVTHNGKADTATAGSNKTLSFLFTNVSDTGVTGQQPTSAYIDHSATADSGWAAGGAVPTGALGGELTSFTPVEEQQGQWTGRITLDVEALDSESPQFYYLHVRAPGSHRTIILDVYGPQVNKDVTSSGNGQGDYTFTIQVQDKAPAGTSSNPEDENAPVYENAGLYQVGWSLTEHDPKALTKPMTVEGVQTISDDNVWLPYDWTFEVTAEQLAQAGGVGDNKVIYLYFKDTLGNTRMIAVPMSEHQMDVSIPTRVGVVAMKGVDTPKVNAPQCALINYGSQALNASVTQVSFTAEVNELTLVAKPGSPNSAFGKKEIDLRIKPLAGEQGYAYSLANLTTPQAQPLSMGQMAAYASEGTANQIGFTFDALYNPQTIVETSNWSMFYLSYRFEAVGSTTAP